MKNKILLIIAAVVFFIFFGWLFMLENNSNNEAAKENKPAIDYVPLSFPNNTIDISDWETYRNNEINFSFSCPKESVLNSSIIGAPYPGIADALGKNFSGYIKLPSGFEILFGGVTKDYSYPRGGSIYDFSGYEEKNGDYFLGSAWGRMKIIPSDKISINNGKDIAIIIKNTEIEMLLDSKQTAVFINTKSNIFPGLVFVISSQNGILSDQDVKTFYNIISSIKFE